MRSSLERIDFFIDEPNSLRNIQIFKKNSVKYMEKSIFPNLMSSALFGYNTINVMNGGK